MFDRCRCKRLRQVLALSDQSMPLHDTGEQAGSGLGLSLVSTKIRYHGRRREAHLVRRRNENAGKSVSRKVCPLCLQTYLLSLSRLRSNASDRWRRRGILCAIRRDAKRREIFTSFHAFRIRSIIKRPVCFFFRKVYKTRSRKESNVTLISLNATVIHFQSTNRSSSIEPNKWSLHFQIFFSRVQIEKSDPFLPKGISTTSNDPKLSFLIIKNTCYIYHRQVFVI